MYDFPKCTMFLQKWILNLQDLPQSQNFETVPVYIVWQYYPHDNIVCIHMCDEYIKSIDSGVCHKPWSILWPIVQAYSLTIEDQVFQFVPSINILEQSGSKLLTIHLCLPILPFKFRDRPSKDLELCKAAPLSCLPVLSIAQCIFEHVLPCRGTTLLFCVKLFPHR